MKARIKSLICVFIAIILLAGSSYINTYYRADQEGVNAATAAKKFDEDILVFEPEENVECGLIFYPGGKVEYTAYSPLMQACAEEGILCVLIKMPCNLAVLDINAADGIQEEFPEIKRWYMAGHSLGGSMAASYLGDNADAFEGLVLLASYSTEDLSDTDLKVLSIYGTEDKVLDMEKYEMHKGNIPDNYVEVVIDGGCHAYFGNYGTQKGDGEAKISVREQQKETVGAIKRFLK